MTVNDKLTILADSAKYDVACTSSGTSRDNTSGGIGTAAIGGICHSFSADGRCISLLKVLLTNICVFDCKYCVNRSSNDIPRAAFTPQELAELTIQFYRRNYIEGLFLSSAVIKNADHTTELMIETLQLLREGYRFNGYIHAKAIPGTDAMLLTRLGLLADRLSVNIEMPSEASLVALAPQKSKISVLKPMGHVTDTITQNRQELQVYKHAPKFAPAGQSTQMIIGASGESDHQILHLSEGLYKRYDLKRVFFSAYIPVAEHALLPSTDTKPPLLREHRLYQADWLIRFYNFTASEILAEGQNFNPYLDPKCNWAIQNMHLFPMDINKCSYDMLLRVPGIGVRSAQRIRKARRNTKLTLKDLKRIGVVLKRAQYFIICNDYMPGLGNSRESTVRALIDPNALGFGSEQLSFLQSPQVQFLTEQGHGDAAKKQLEQEVIKCLQAKM